MTRSHHPLFCLYSSYRSTTSIVDMDLSEIHDLPQAQQDEILNGAALPPPDGIVSNYHNPPNGDALAYTAVTLCLVVSTFAVFVRVYAKFFRAKKIKVEDCLMVVAYGLFVGYIYITYWLLDIIGFFVHQWDVRLKDFWTLLYIIHIGSNLYAVTMLIMKASILKEWSRIFVPYGTRNAFWWTSHIVIVINVLFYGVSVFLENLSCFPYQRIWDKTVPGSQCLDFKVTPLAGASINVILDLITLILPQKTIWSLQLTRKKKIGVSLVFAIGILACAAATARIVYTVFYFRSDDTAYTLSALSLWLIAEMTCMFLIFAGPAAPQAFARADWMVKFKATFRSWSAKQPTETTANSWPGSTADATKSRRIYRKIDELELGTINRTSTGDGLPHSNEPFQNEGTSSSGIMCTKQFSTAEEYVEGGYKEDWIRLQHSWNNAQV
ncbi:hypothetical protein HD806DRAFT_499695 [Xylariaceae sp. AK1471]|nr:hypothetical protein HD806DRAFT_499695 [Xylariaceae sp. AK1471]